MKKLKTKIEFEFEGQEDIPEFNAVMKLKTRRKTSDIKIIEHKRKKKIVDASTKLF